MFSNAGMVLAKHFQQNIELKKCFITILRFKQVFREGIVQSGLSQANAIRNKCRQSEIKMQISKLATNFHRHLIIIMILLIT